MLRFTWRENDDTQQWELVDDREHVVAVVVYEEVIIAKNDPTVKQYLREKMYLPEEAFACTPTSE